MKRLAATLAALLLLAGLSFQGIAAQNASPAAGATPTSALLDALGYPTLSIAYDGTNVTLPATLEAGRYMVDFSSTASAPPQVTFFLGATADHSVDDILAALQSADLSQGPPPIYYQVHVAGLSDSGAPTVVTLTPGDWAFAAIGDQGPAIAKLTVTGELPAFDPISGSVNVDLHEMVIDMPDTVPAGDHIWQVENTGSFVHVLSVAKVSGPITDEQLLNALALEMGDPSATPVADGSVGDPNNIQPVLDSGEFSNGLTQLFEMNLDPGTYVAICFLSGPGDVGMHAMDGMYKIFTVE